MTEYNFKKLQNGSDIRGIALTGVPGELPNLTPDETIRLTRGYLLWLCEKTGKSPSELKIGIGRDPRMSGQHLAHAVISGFGPYGVSVFDCGLASTPAMFMSTVFPEFDFDGAIMITASHLPYNRNGFKYFSRDGGLDKKDISRIIEIAESDEKLQALGEPTHVDSFSLVLGKKTYPSQPCELMKKYCAHLRNIIIDGVNSTADRNKPLDGLNIVVDAGNGAGGFYAKEVLKPLGADISSSQYLEPDGTFPNHPPNPENKEAMNSISMAVLTSGADFGLIFDTDVDRSAAVDHRGRELSRNKIIAMAAALIAEDHPGTTVVTDSITSTQLTSFLEKDLRLKHLRFKRGYKNVINKAIELNEGGIDCQLAMETSGHGALKENYFLDDGAYLATKIVIKAAKLRAAGQTPESLIESLEEPLENAEFRLPLTCEDFAAYADGILEDLRTWAENSQDAMSLTQPNYEGVRIDFAEDSGNGWCLLRKSLHDPLMPLNIESDSQGGVKYICEKLASFLKGYPDLDISKLIK